MRKSVIAAVCGCALPVLAGVSAAGTITLDYPEANIASFSGGVMDARYRVSNTNWDQIIATDSNITPSVIVQQANFGTHNQLNGATWDFSISYSPANGWAYRLGLVSGGSPNTSSSTLVWNAPFNGTAFDRSFNALEMFAVIGGLPAGISSMSMAATGLTFSSPGNTIVGTLPNVISTGGLVRTWVYSDSDLASTAWTLSGRLVGSFVGSTSSNLDERIKFDVKGTTVTLIPTPAASAMLGMGALFSARRRRQA
jgi:hypothetical protein